MKVFIETLGCPKNFYDSDIVKGELRLKGHQMVENPEEADIIMVNTCGFINDAKKESIERIFEMSHLKKEDGKLIVSGCLSQRYGEELSKEMPEVDIFIGVNDYDKLHDIIENTCKEKLYISECSDKELLDMNLNGDNKYSATLKIAEGCNNRCAYCIIPYIRGKYRSKREENVLKEAQALADAGCKELILIAQDTTYYGYDLYGEYRLAKLLKKLCKIDKIQWIRLMYCYEDRITDELIETIKSEEKICKYIDIPLQHSSNSILRAMKRRSTKDSIKSTISKLKKQIPDIHIRTTIIVGFPGETEKDFDEVYDFVKEEKFARLGTFAYSREEGTEAGEMTNQIDDEIKAERADSIMRLQMEISLEENRKKIGTIQEVIVEGIDEDGSYIGRTRYDAPEIDNGVLFTSNRGLKEGDIVKVKIEDAFDYDIVGREVG